MRAHHDPKYIKLLELLTAEEAEKLLLFLSCRTDQDDSVKLAYRPREERTKVSPNIGERSWSEITEQVGV